MNDNVCYADINYSDLTITNGMRALDVLLSEWVKSHDKCLQELAEGVFFPMPPDRAKEQHFGLYGSCFELDGEIVFSGLVLGGMNPVKADEVTEQFLRALRDIDELLNRDRFALVSNLYIRFEALNNSLPVLGRISSEDVEEARTLVNRKVVDSLNGDLYRGLLSSYGYRPKYPLGEELSYDYEHEVRERCHQYIVDHLVSLM